MEITSTRSGRALRRLVRVVLPTDCPGCGQPSEGICSDCLKRVVLVRSQGCYYFGTLGAGGRTCPACRRRSALSGVAVAAHYEGAIKEAIQKFKYESGRGLASALAPILKIAIRGTRARALVAVPLHRRREWYRGYNQSELLAQAISSDDLPYLGILRRVRHGRPQVELGRRERLKNLEAAFEAVGTPPPRVLLIDDVATPGAPLKACARVLRAAGAREVWAAVLARHK